MSNFDRSTLEGEKFAMASFLDRFERSPYSYPENDYKQTSAESSEKGCWHQKKN